MKLFNQLINQLSYLLRLAPGPQGHPSLVSILATLQEYCAATIVSSQCCTIATRIALTDLLELLFIET